MLNGDFVIVEDFEGKLLKRRVFKEISDIVLICKNEEFEAALKENREPVCAGFKKKYVSLDRQAPVK